ncbi:unnamed protein product, partial [Sphacelaria rigidula]
MRSSAFVSLAVLCSSSITYIAAQDTCSADGDCESQCCGLFSDDPVCQEAGNMPYGEICKTLDGCDCD